MLAPAAGAATCELEPPRPKVSVKEQRLRATIADRKRMGFRHDRAFVRRVNADRAARRRALGYFPMTRREYRYAIARDALATGPRYERMDAYMQRHRDVFGDVAIEDDWPDGAYLRLGVTRDDARHRAALRRFGIRFRLSRVGWSRRELLRIQRRLDREFEALAAEGIHYVSSGLHADAFNRLTVEIATTRADAREVLRRRYGGAIRVIVVGPAPRFLDCRPVDRYEVEPDGVTLKVHWGDSGSITPKHVEVIETADTVYLGAVAETGFSEHADLRYYTLTATLSQPLGGRAVKNIEYGAAVRPGPPDG